MSKLKSLARDHPMIRGMVAYACIWPTSSIIQQTYEHRTKPGRYDLAKAFRYGLWGSLFVAPTLFVWMKISGKMFPANNLASSIKRALTEQVSYGPFSLISFYTGMSLLEGQSYEGAVQELKSKGWPTYKVAVCFWPVVQTLNFYLVPARNRVVVVSASSLLWTCFLAHMKSRDEIKKKKNTLK